MAPLMIKAHSRAYKQARERERRGSQVSYSWWRWLQSRVLAKSWLDGGALASGSSSSSSVLLGIVSSRFHPCVRRVSERPANPYLGADLLLCNTSKPSTKNNTFRILVVIILKNFSFKCLISFAFKIFFV
jgi:hypothetical protein